MTTRRADESDEERKARQRAYRAANRERFAQNERNWRVRGGEALRARLRLAQKARRDANHEAVLARERAYAEANKERIAARMRRWREANVERLAAYDKSYAEDHRKETAAYRRRKRAQNPEKHRAEVKDYVRRNREQVLARKREDWAAFREVRNESRALKAMIGDCRDESVRAAAVQLYRLRKTVRAKARVA